MRNYKKEAAWAKGKYIRISVRLEKELGKNLKKKLKIKGLSISNWVRQNAKTYLNSD